MNTNQTKKFIIQFRDADRKDVNGESVSDRDAEGFAIKLKNQLDCVENIQVTREKSNLKAQNVGDILSVVMDSTTINTVVTLTAITLQLLDFVWQKTSIVIKTVSGEEIMISLREVTKLLGDSVFVIQRSNNNSDDTKNLPHEQAVKTLPKYLEPDPNILASPPEKSPRESE